MEKRKCLICAKIFNPITRRHKFCCRKCFITYYRREAKTEEFPYYVCPNCGEKTKLKFNPKKNEKKFQDYKCPICKFNRKEEVEKEKNIIKEKKEIKRKIFF